VYAQTYGDVWDEKSKAFLAQALEQDGGAEAPQATAAAQEAGEASPG
jgi:hypothetical protein